MRKSAMLLCLLVAGCQTAAGNPPAASIAPVSEAEAFAKARSHLLASLKDPNSAQIASVRRAGEYVCGQVNAKNSFGAYDGSRQFAVNPAGEVFFQGDAGLGAAVAMQTCWRG
jgi:hypothetical protein